MSSERSFSYSRILFWIEGEYSSVLKPFYLKTY
jgi:hypothetical protein